MISIARPRSDSREAFPPGVMRPGDPGYDEARLAWNLIADQNPAVIALPRSASEVVQIVRAARAAGLRVAAQATGHNAPPLGDLSDTVLLKINFAEARTDVSAFYGETAYERLRRIRAQVDPDGLFRANHEIPPAGDDR